MASRSRRVGRGRRGQAGASVLAGVAGSHPRPTAPRGGGSGRGGYTPVTPGGRRAPGRGRRKSRVRAHKAAAAAQAAGGLHPTSGREAAGRSPPSGPAPQTSGRPRRPAPSRAQPRRLAREPLPPTKPPLRGQSPGALPAAASPRLLPDKKVIGRRPPWGPGAVRSAGLTRAALQAPPPESRLVWLAATATAAALLSPK